MSDLLQVKHRSSALMSDKDYRAAFSQYPQFIQSILAHRDISSQHDLDDSLQRLKDPFLMLGMAEGVDRLLLALKEQQRILIVGDFDADGATSTALLMRGLAALGFQRVDYLLPDRFIFGYGLSAAIVADIAARKNLPNVLITVDNGISSIEGVAKANALGIDVIVTDHHLPGDNIPDAFAIINPNQRGCQFEHKNLAGVGVAFHLLVALRKACRDCDYFNQFNIKEPHLASLLDIVALGTVADVVKLDAYNRILVVQGLKRIRSGLAGAGINALLAVAKKDLRHLCAQDIGFTLGPRINAAGRLDDMRLGVELLLENDAERALGLARELDDLNQDRKLIQAQMQAEAEVIVQSLMSDLNVLPRIVCVFHPEWHQGVVGLIASKLKDALHRPVFAFAPVFDEEGDLIEYKGSGRSIAGVHLRDVLDLIAKTSPGCLEKFGGHAMAAGLSLSVDQLPVFESSASAIMQTFESSIFEQTVWVDATLNAEDIQLSNALALEFLLPWGQGIPQPLFVGEFYLDSLRVLSSKHVKAQLKLGKQGVNIDAICFGADIEKWQLIDNSATKMVHAVYSMTVNRFRGDQSLQLVIDFIH